MRSQSSGQGLGSGDGMWCLCIGECLCLLVACWMQAKEGEEGVKCIDDGLLRFGLVYPFVIVSMTIQTGRRKFIGVPRHNDDAQNRQCSGYGTCFFANGRHYAAALIIGCRGLSPCSSKILRLDECYRSLGRQFRKGFLQRRGEIVHRRIKISLYGVENIQMVSGQRQESQVIYEPRRRVQFMRSGITFQ